MSDLEERLRRILQQRFDRAATAPIVVDASLRRRVRRRQLRNGALCAALVAALAAGSFAGLRLQARTEPGPNGTPPSAWHRSAVLGVQVAYPPGWSFEDIQSYGDQVYVQDRDPTRPYANTANAWAASPLFAVTNGEAVLPAGCDHLVPTMRRGSAYLVVLQGRPPGIEFDSWPTPPERLSWRRGPCGGRGLQAWWEYRGRHFGAVMALGKGSSSARATLWDILRSLRFGVSGPALPPNPEPLLADPTPRYLVATGPIAGGGRWRLAAWRPYFGPDRTDGICVGEDELGPRPSASSGCGPAELPPSGFRYRVGDSGTLSEANGTVLPQAARVELRLSDGRVLSSRAYPMPRYLRLPVRLRFFFISIEGDPIPGELVALDGQGREIARTPFAIPTGAP